MSYGQIWLMKVFILMSRIRLVPSYSPMIFSLILNIFSISEMKLTTDKLN